MARKQAPFAAPQREDTMKIDAVEVTLFAWDDIPPTRYTQGTHNTSGRSNLGLLRIKTDDGVEGNAFLGYAVNPAETDAGALIRFLKPVLVGKDALARAGVHAAMRGSTWSYRYPDAVGVGRAIERLGFLWYEDPLNEEDIHSYVQLRQKLDIPIIATEYPAGDIGTYAVWLTERATDALRGDIAVKGGLTTMLKAAHLAEAFHMNYEVHHGGNSLNNLAQLHFACAVRNTTYFEVLLPHGAHKYGLLEDIDVGKDGLARCPQLPGIGGKIDFDRIERKRLGRLSGHRRTPRFNGSRPKS